MSFVITLYVREGIVMASDSRLTLTQSAMLPLQQDQQQQDQQVQYDQQQQDQQVQYDQQLQDQQLQELQDQQNQQDQQQVQYDQLPPPPPDPQEAHQQIVQYMAVGQSDSTYKTFLTARNVGISTYGDADIEGVPISGHIESFINEELPQNYEVDYVPQRLLDYFKAMPGPPAVGFFVAGYKTEAGGRREPYVYRVSVSDDDAYLVNEDGTQGASWGGEIDILIRLVLPLGQMDTEGNFTELPEYDIPWGFFTLQDAIDYAIYAVNATIESIRFQPRPKTVGGAVDVLVIKPQDEAFWVQRKELHGVTRLHNRATVYEG